MKEMGHTLRTTTKSSEGVMCAPRAVYAKRYGADKSGRGRSGTLGGLAPTRSVLTGVGPAVVSRPRVDERVAEDFSRRDATIVERVLKRASRVGRKIGLVNAIRLGRVIARDRMRMHDLEELNTRYFGGWSDATTLHKFIGYRDGVSVRRARRVHGPAAGLRVAPDATSLLECDTHDATRIVIEVVDGESNVLVYSHEPVTTAVEGPWRQSDRRFEA